MGGTLRFFGGLLSPILLFIDTRKTFAMSESVQGVSPSSAGTQTDGDSDALGSEFGKMLLKSGLMFFQGLQSDVTDAISDNTSDPDEPF